MASAWSRLLELAQKLRDGRHHRLLLVFAQLGEDGQGQDFASRTLGFREAAFGIAQALQCVLQVQRDGVVDLRADLAASEELAQRIAAGACG